MNEAFLKETGSTEAEKKARLEASAFEITKHLA
jgi:hypothetical protein